MARYLAGKNSTVKINGLSMKVESGSVTTGIEVDEVTNNFSGGYYEDVDTVRKATCNNLSLLYDADDPPEFEEGDIVDLESLVTDGPTVTGKFRIGSITMTVHNVKQAVRYTFDATSQGVYTRSWGAV